MNNPRNKTAQSGASNNARSEPGKVVQRKVAAPPAYRPQPLQKCLQPKTARNQAPAPQLIGPSVYRPQPKKIVPPRAVQLSRSNTGAIQRAQAPNCVFYGQALLEYSQEELAKAAQDEGVEGYTGHLSGGSNDGVSGATQQAMARIIERARANRGEARDNKKAEIASARAEKQAFKRPARSTVKKMAIALADKWSHDYGTGLEKFAKYLKDEGFSEEEIWGDYINLYPEK
jgi:hypothetical protein